MWAFGLCIDVNYLSRFLVRERNKPKISKDIEVPKLNYNEDNYDMDKIIFIQDFFKFSRLKKIRNLNTRLKLKKAITTMRIYCLESKLMNEIKVLKMTNYAISVTNKNMSNALIS